MDFKPFLSRLFDSFSRYYTFRSEGVMAPFVAEAEFKSHTEQYVLVRAAKIADIDSNEYVYFATQESLDAAGFSLLRDAAWERGLSRVKPYSGHRNSDVTLIILTGHVADDVPPLIKRTHLSRDYRWGLWGWSCFRVIAAEIPSGQLFCNRRGKDLRKICSSCLGSLV